MSILPNIYGETTRESLIEIHRLISGNSVSVASDIGGGRHGHLAITMTAEDYLAQTGCTFGPPHNPGDYPPEMEASQDQALGTERFLKNQALFR